MLHDPLTGLASRSLLLDRLDHVMRRPTRTQHHTLVLSIDLDGFRTINNDAGHPVGDHVLRVVTDRVRESVRHHDTVARFGGDEFVVVAEDLLWPSEANELGHQLLDAVSQPIRFVFGDIAVTATLGGAIAVDGARGEDVLRAAGAAMREVKQQGGNAIAFTGVDCRS